MDGVKHIFTVVHSSLARGNMGYLNGFQDVAVAGRGWCGGEKMREGEIR